MKKSWPWLGAVAILVIIFGTMYGVVQQSQRRGADYPQIQIAEDTAAELDGGAMPSSLAQGNVDMARSLAPFVIVYDKSGKVVTGSGYLDGKLPQVPIGVLQHARGKDYSVVTWQPKSGVRIAAVSTAAQKYYVLSGRSLTEVERNESLSFKLAFLGGLLSLLVLVVVYRLTIY